MGVYRQRNVAHHKCHAHLMDVSGERHLASCLVGRLALRLHF